MIDPYFLISDNTFIIYSLAYQVKAGETLSKIQIILTLRLSLFIIAHMERGQIKQIMDYLRELEEEIEKEYNEQYYRGLFCLQDINMLYGIINYLMESTYMTDDQQVKPLLLFWNTGPVSARIT